MAKNDAPSDKQIYELCKAVYNYEKFLENILKNKEYIGYLIETDTLNKIKKKLDYERLKPYVEKDSYTNFAKNIKKREKIKSVKLKKFNDSKEFIIELLKDKKYSLVHHALLDKLNCDYKGKEIKYIIIHDKISLIFNDNDKLYLTNNKNGIIEKSSLIQENSNSSEIPSSGPKDFDIKEKILFKHDLEILIRIFYFNKYLREKENNIFNELKNEENNETIYLINNSWMEEYKSFFDYNTLEQILIKFFDTNNITDNYISESKIKNIMKNLPSDYINKINLKGQFAINKTFNYEQKDLNNNIRYTYNNCIINSKINKLLMEQKYKLNNSIKKADLFFIGNKKIILIFPVGVDNNKENHEIGFVNDSGIFIPEFILEFSHNVISYDILNKFLKNDFPKFMPDKTKDNCKIKNINDNESGYCYKIKGILENKENKINNNTNKAKDGPENNTKNRENKKESIRNETLNLNNNSSNQRRGNENENRKINPYIELMINIYLFQEDLKNKINKTLSQSFEGNNFCIRKKLLDKFKSLFDYKKFISYIKKGNILQIQKDFQTKKDVDKFLDDIIKLCPDDFINNINNISKDEEKIKKYFDNEPISLEIKNKNNIYYYNDEIEIINEDIIDLIKEIFKIKYGEKQRLFLCGDKAIIIEFDIMPQNSIIIGKYNNNYFEQDILLCFDKNEDMKNYFNKIHEKGYISFESKELKFDNNNVINLIENSNIIGKAYKIKEIEKNQINNTNIINNFNNNIIDTQNNIISYNEPKNIISSTNENKNNFNQQ